MWQAGERHREREREEKERDPGEGRERAGESPSLDSMSLNRTLSRYGARVVTQSHPGLDALTLSHALAFPRKAVSHRHPSIAISPHLHRRRFTAAAAVVPGSLLAPLILRHVLSNTYARIKIRTVNPNKHEDVHSAVCVCVCV